MPAMRPYRSADLAALQAFLRAYPTPLEIYPTADDLAELLSPALWDVERGAVVWEDDGLAGFAVVSRYDNLHYAFRPAALTAAVEDEMIRWAADRIHERAADGSAHTLDASARSDDAAKQALLDRHGFAPVGVQTVRMARSLTAPLPALVIPAGWTLRPLAGVDEVAAYVAAHRAAYGTEHMTVEERAAMLADPHYRPELDLVLVAPGGDLAAFAVNFVNPADNERDGLSAGEVGIVGTVPAYQRQGLGRLAVLASLHALRAAGLATAVLGVSSVNAAAVRTYEHLGFAPRYALDWYAKAVS